MISNTRQNFNDRGGAMFLIWGYTTIAVTITVTTLLYLTLSGKVMWLVFSVATFACAAFASIAPIFIGKQLINVLFTIGLMMSMATALTGAIIKFKPVVTGGFSGILLSFAILIVADTIWQLPLFAAIFLVAQVIPGHWLNAACKREAEKRRTT
jgi:hypothetical protein